MQRRVAHPAEHDWELKVPFEGTGEEDYVRRELSLRLR
jgi:hypothetical protein